MFLKSEMSVEFNQSHVFEPYIFWFCETALCCILDDFSVKLAKFITSSCFIIIHLLKYKHLSWKDQVILFSQFMGKQVSVNVVFIHLCLTRR